jgi:tripartite-type tricarboxylate transporter receptor subunit TctC
MPIGFINTPNFLSMPIERQTRYSPDNFSLIGNIIDDPSAFAVHSDSKFKSLQNLVEYAKVNPGAVTIGTSGVGSDDHIAMLMLQQQAGIKLTHVPFQGASTVRTAMLGQHITVASMNIGESLQSVGQPIHFLGQMSQTRWSQAATVPTFKEQGFNIELSSLRGIAAPKGLPPEIRDHLVEAVRKAANDPEFTLKANQTMGALRYLAPDEYAAVLKTAEKEFRDLWAAVPWGAQ